MIKKSRNQGDMRRGKAFLAEDLTGEDHCTGCDVEYDINLLAPEFYI